MPHVPSRRPRAPRKSQKPRPPKSSRPAKFVAPTRGPIPAERILVAYAADQRDPGLDDYIAIMAGHGHEVLELEIDTPEPAAARNRIRAHPQLKAGKIGGVILSGRGIPPFAFEPRSDSGPLTDYSDLPFGSDFTGFMGDEPLVAAQLARHLKADPTPYQQSQWVSRIFSFNSAFLENLRTTQPPQTNNLLIVNADPNSDDPVIQNRWRQRYSWLAAAQNARFAFRGLDFPTEELLSYLENNLTNTTFLSVTDHGNSTNLENLPGMRNGSPQLPSLPDFVELAACATGRWMDDTALPMIKGLAETSLERGALAVIAPQCLLAWNFAKGIVGRPAKYDPLTDQFDQEIHNIAPWLDVWPRQGSIGRALRFSIDETIAFLREAAYFDKGYLLHQIFCGHSLFGDGTLEFQGT